MTFFYMLLAFIVGLLLGWSLWGRLRGELDALRSSLESTRSERERLKADANRLSGELEACRSARADLERQTQETKTPSPAASLISTPAAAVSRASAAPGKPTKPAASKLTTAKLAKTEPAKGKATKTSLAKPKPANTSKKDNLRRLIGIGPVNERKLNKHGITTFAQIASWTAADIKRVEEYLEFDGRIKREKWVQQAKLLATGKEKEFARRFPTAGSSDNT